MKGTVCHQMSVQHYQQTFPKHHILKSPISREDSYCKQLVVYYSSPFWHHHIIYLKECCQVNVMVEHFLGMQEVVGLVLSRIKQKTLNFEVPLLYLALST